MKDVFRKFDLSGRVTVVTGGAGLLGTQFCQTLAGAGAAVVVADIDKSAAFEVARCLKQDGCTALGCELDVTRPESNRQLVTQTLKAFGHIDVLVNSAALDPKFDAQHLQADHSGAFEDFPLELWRRALDVNLTGMFLACQAVVKPMLAQGGGVIVNICSMYGLVGPDQRLYQQEGQPERFKPVYYSASKAGVLGLTSYLATYYAGRNIRVNALTPGGVFSEHEGAFVKAYAARSVLGRMAERDEMNGALLFLASEASSYMTGANLIVDGGWTAW